MKSGLILIGLSTLFLGALATGAPAQDLTLSLGDDASLSARTLQLIALITVLSLAPGIAIMVTCFPFVVTVLSILRQGIGLQQSPPNMLIVSLALFLRNACPLIWPLNGRWHRSACSCWAVSTPTLWQP